MWSDPTNPTRPRRERRWWLTLLAVWTACAAWFAWGLDREPEFVDEWAYVSQAYFGPLVIQPDDPRWLEYPAYDLPPWPKYQIAMALAMGGHPLPGREAMQRWYANTSTRFGAHAMLVSARRPSALLGGLGCAALFALGSLVDRPRTGLLAALLLAINPLYAMHARRAMSDVPMEAFGLAALAAALAAWTRLERSQDLRNRLVAAGQLVGAGALAGLSVLCKLSGGLFVMVLGAWSMLFLVLPGLDAPARRVGLLATFVCGLVAYGTFVALNPFLWSSPTGRQPAPIARTAALGVIDRTRLLLRHRFEVSRNAMSQFPQDATTSTGDKVAAVGVQGFGRFGLLGRKVAVPPEDRRDPERQTVDFDSRVRYDRRQDLGAIVWLPLVLAGGAIVAVRGVAAMRAGVLPVSLAVLVQAALTWGTVTLFLPLAWDRYFLPLQSVSTLLAAIALLAAFDRLFAARSVVGGSGA